MSKNFLNNFSYTLVKCMDLVGVCFVFFVKTKNKDKIKNFDSVIIKTGLMGAMGNKGSCLIRFNYLDTTFAFSCGHLAAGSSHNTSRLNEINEVLNKNFPLNKELRFKDHNIVFIFGDLNFRVDLDYENVIKLVKQRDIGLLLQYDQFLKSKEVNFNLSDIDEGIINFNPTYKYVYGSKEYDSKKKRIPSWCDRILFKKSNLISQVVYDRAELTLSDHRPIYSVFNILATKELKEKKSMMLSDIKQNILLGLNQFNKQEVELQNKNTVKKSFTLNQNNNEIFSENNKVMKKKSTVDSNFDTNMEESEIMNFFK